MKFLLKLRNLSPLRPSARPTFMEIIEQLLDDVNQNFRNVAFYFSKEAQDALHQLRHGDYGKKNQMMFCFGWQGWRKCLRVILNFNQTSYG